LICAISNAARGMADEKRWNIYRLTGEHALPSCGDYFYMKVLKKQNRDRLMLGEVENHETSIEKT
jgi:hypothetical protein